MLPPQTWGRGEAQVTALEGKSLLGELNSLSLFLLCGLPPWQIPRAWPTAHLHAAATTSVPPVRTDQSRTLPSTVLRGSCDMTLLKSPLPCSLPSLSWGYTLGPCSSGSTLRPSPQL